MMLRLGRALCLLQLSCLIFTAHSRVSWTHFARYFLCQRFYRLLMNQLIMLT